MKLNYKLYAGILENGIISMELRNATETLSRLVMNTRDEVTRKALITLGWTPPPNNSDAVEYKPFLSEECSVPKHEPRIFSLEERCYALEKLVIELALIAIATATIKHHHKARLDELLGELQYAGHQTPHKPRV